MKRNTELFGPAGTPRVVVVGVRIRRHRRRREAEARRHRHVHDLREVRAGRRHLVGQPVPRLRGRRRLVRLLVPVQALRLDAHAREAGRAAPLPRGDGRATSGCGRTSGSASAVDRAEWDEQHAHVYAHARQRRDARVPRPDLGHRLPQRAAVPRLAGPRRLPAARSSTRRGGSTSTTSPARPSRSWARAPRRRRSSRRSRRS